MLSSLFLVFLLVPPQNPLQEAQRHMLSGNYLMAEVELLRANPAEDPVQVASLYSELAIRMRNVPGKMEFAQKSLLSNFEWRSSALLALANLALTQKDWAGFERFASDFLKAGYLKNHPVRFQLLYHYARHTNLPESSLPLSSEEFAWVRLCRELSPSQTWPDASSLPIPYLFRHGSLLEQRNAFTVPNPSGQPSTQNEVAAQLFSIRTHLNSGNMNQVATTLNQLIAMDRTRVTDHLRMHLYQLMLEYFQRQQDTTSALKTAQNLDLVRERAFLPIQSWPGRIQQLKAQSPASAATEPRPASEPKPAATIANQPLVPPTQTATQVEPSTEPAEDLSDLPEASFEDEPESTGLEQPEELLMEEEAAFEPVPEPMVEDMPDSLEPRVPIVRRPDSGKSRTADVNLNLARALMADGNDLMAEAQMMDVKPRREDVLEMGIDLATLAIRTQTVENKETFFRSYLDRKDAWRGVALAVLTVFRAQTLDWAGLEHYAGQLLSEFGPLEGPANYRLLYYLARYTPYQPNTLRPEEALWFQRARDLSPTALWPHCPELDLPFAYRHGHLLETTGWSTPELGRDSTLEATFFQKLLTVREALNQEDFQKAALALKSLKDLAGEPLDYQWRVLHQDLAHEYFEKRGESDNAAIAKRNAAVYQTWTAFPLRRFQARSEQVANALRDAAAKKNLPADTHPPVAQPKPEPTLPLPTPEADAPLATPVLVDGNSSWLDFELAIDRGNLNLENTLRGKEPVTTYDRIYKDYLLGALYLKRGRYQSAYERLTLAENLVRDLPFPLLESKVMLGMADYYDYERNEQQANWYRIAAVQIWNQPANIPILASDETRKVRSPFPELLDQALKKTSLPGTIHTLIYYNELSLLLNLRNKAYLRGQLSDNRAVGQQLSAVGQELARMVREVATQQSPSVTPRQFNDSQKLWTGLWDQAYPYYRNEEVPGLAALQASLEEDERLVAFVEGSAFFGVLILSRDQNFAVGLGNKSNFFNLTTEKQLDFLEGRLGPVWGHPGRLTLQLSPSFQNQGLTDQLKRRMAHPQRLRFVYSLKNAMAASQPDTQVRTLMMFPNFVDANTTLPVISPDQTPTVFWANTASQALLLSQLEQHHHLVVSGPLRQSEQGLAVQTGNLQVYLHELPSYQPDLCSVTLLASSIPPMGLLIEELALVQVRRGTAIQVVKGWPPAPLPLPDRHVRLE